VATAVATAAAAQTYPSHSIRLFVGFAPGGGADAVARAYADHVAQALGQHVIIEDRPGSASSLAADVVAHAAHDGYTLLIASPASISVNPALNPKIGYKPADLAPVTKLSASPLVLATNPAAGFASVKELIATAKKNPGDLNYASPGVGSAPHFAAVLFSHSTGIVMEHVPFKAEAPAVVSVVAGDTQLIFGTPSSVLPMVKAGRLRALAVTSPDRSALMSDIPGMEEAGLPDYELTLWYGLFVPAGTPADVVWRLFEAATTAARNPEVKVALARQGMEVAVSKSPIEFGMFLEDDARFWLKLVKDSGAVPE
jgi:tripartite-type tricarboxylate transporter receptor subunit TctC